MQTTIRQVNPAEYELEIHATDEDLKPDIDKAVRAQRARTTMKGFRPGKVPVSLVKKMHGKALAYGVVDQKVQATYEAEVLGTGDYEVLGRPTMTTLDYEPDGDLHAVIRFGVRPEVELQDLSDETLSRLVYEATEEDVDAEIERMREQHAELEPSDEPLTEEHQVVVDLQRLDEASGTPIIGEKEADVTFFLDDPRLKDALKEALLGRSPGDVFRVDLPKEGDDGEIAGTERYEVTVKEAKVRVLPALEEAFIKEVTGDRFETEEALRAHLKEQVQQAWDRRSREFLESDLIDRMLSLHPVPVPESVVDMFLDSFVEDVRERNQGDVPEGFDEQVFRETNRGEAERQGRWMLIRDQVIDAFDVEVSDDDREAFYEESSGGEVSPEMLRQYYQAVPRLREQLDQRLLTKRVFDVLEERFDVVDVDREAFEQQLEERRAAREAEADEGASVELPSAAAEE